MEKYNKLATFLCVLVGGILITPLLMIVPPIGMLFLFIAPIAFFALPFALIVCSVIWIILEKNKTKIIPIVLLCTIVLFFKFGVLWLAWALTFTISVLIILFITKWWKQSKNILFKTILSILLVVMAINLFATLNPFVSFFGFFGTGKLIALNIEKGNPCNTCQNVKNTCDNLENIKNCYCCECIKNLKFCNDCFFFWNNSYKFNPITNKCEVGW